MRSERLPRYECCSVVDHRRTRTFGSHAAGGVNLAAAVHAEPAPARVHWKLMDQNMPNPKLPTYLDQRQQTAVAMLMSGETWQDVARSTGLSFGEIQQAWTRRGGRGGLTQLVERYLTPKVDWVSRRLNN